MPKLIENEAMMNALKAWVEKNKKENEALAASASNASLLEQARQASGGTAFAETRSAPEGEYEGIDMWEAIKHINNQYYDTGNMTSQALDQALKGNSAGSSLIGGDFQYSPEMATRLGVDEKIDGGLQNPYTTTKTQKDAVNQIKGLLNQNGYESYEDIVQSVEGSKNDLYPNLGVGNALYNDRESGFRPQGGSSRQIEYDMLRTNMSDTDSVGEYNLSEAGQFEKPGMFGGAGAAMFAALLAPLTAGMSVVAQQALSATAGGNTLHREDYGNAALAVAAPFIEENVFSTFGNNDAVGGFLRGSGNNVLKSAVIDGKIDLESALKSGLMGGATSIAKDYFDDAMQTGNIHDLRREITLTEGLTGEALEARVDELHRTSDLGGLLGENNTLNNAFGSSPGFISTKPLNAVFDAIKKPLSIFTDPNSLWSGIIARDDSLLANNSRFQDLTSNQEALKDSLAAGNITPEEFSTGNIAIENQKQDLWNQFDRNENITVLDPNDFSEDLQNSLTENQNQKSALEQELYDNPGLTDARRTELTGELEMLDAVEESIYERGQIEATAYDERFYADWRDERSEESTLHGIKTENPFSSDPSGGFFGEGLPDSSGTATGTGTPPATGTSVTVAGENTLPEATDTNTTQIVDSVFGLGGSLFNSFQNNTKGPSDEVAESEDSTLPQVQNPDDIFERQLIEAIRNAETVDLRDALIEEYNWYTSEDNIISENELLEGDVTDSIDGDLLASIDDIIPSGDDKLPSGDDELPSGDDKLPSGDDELPSGDDKLPDPDNEKIPIPDDVNLPPGGGGGGGAGGGSLEKLLSRRAPEDDDELYRLAKIMKIEGLPENIAVAVMARIKGLLAGREQDSDVAGDVTAMRDKKARRIGQRIDVDKRPRRAANVTSAENKIQQVIKEALVA